MPKKILMILCFLLVTQSAFSFYTNNLNLKNNKSVFYFANYNDGFGFQFSNYYDDLRSAGFYFGYFSENNFKIETSLNMLTYRGFKEDYKGSDKIKSCQVCGRADLLDILFLYYFYFPLKDFSLDLGLGARTYIYGNLGGLIAQHIVHFFVQQPRPIPKNFDPYDFRLFASLALNLSYKDLLYFENDFHLSYKADYNFSTNLRLELSNEDFSLNVKPYYRFQNKLGFKVFDYVQESETGAGIAYYMRAGGLVRYLDFMYFVENTADNDWTSIGTVGLIFQERGENFSYNNLFSKKIGFGFKYSFRFNFSDEFYYNLDEHVKNLSLYLSFTRGSVGHLKLTSFLENKFSLGTFYKIPFFDNNFLYFTIMTGLFIKNSNEAIERDEVYRPLKYKYFLKAGVELQAGFDVKFIEADDLNYYFSLNTMMDYSPIVYSYEYKSLISELEHIFSFYYYRLGVTVRY